jgi:hypothetical protein
LEDIMAQVFFCDWCHLIAAVAHHRSDDVMTVANRIGDLHEKVSPNCTNSALKLKLICPEFCDSGQILMKPVSGSEKHDPVTR